MSEPAPSGPAGPVVASKPEIGRENRRKKESKGKFAFLREIPVLIILALALALVIKTFLVQAFYIPSASMEPTLMTGDRVLVNKVIYRLHDPRRGDIIVFEDPNPGTEPDRNPLESFLDWLSQGLGFSRSSEEDFIKRVMGLPGETIEGRDGAVWVDGERIDEPYLNGVKTSDFEAVIVPEGELFVMGDNRSNSNDSRFMGTIPIDRVVGKAFVKIWPPSRVGWL